MKIEEIAICKLSLDPANARKHGEANHAAIIASLRRFGQQKPIVIDKSGVVRAGNGTLAAAKELGWKKIKCVRSELMSTEMTAFAIADNRTAELAQWDDPVLAAQLESLRDAGVSLEELGFDGKDLAKLTDHEPSATAGADEGSSTEKWMVVVTCSGDADQAALLDEQRAAGRECRALLG